MRPHALISLVVLLFVVQSCCCCTMLGGPQPPYSITPSEEVARQLEERLDSLTPGPDGAYTITITDAEITSLVATQLAGLEQRGPASPLSNPQVYFRNGRIEVYADLGLSGSLAVPCMVAVSMAIENGVGVVTVEEIVAGPLPVPASLAQQLTETIADGLTAGAEFTITGIQIGEGQMTLTFQASPR